MNIKDKINKNFEGVAGGLFSNVAKADVGEGAGNLLKSGVDIMAWADPFFPNPTVPRSVKDVMISAIEEGLVSHYTIPIGMVELREVLSKKIEEKTGLSIDPSRNIIITPGSDSGLLYAMMPFISEGDEVMVPSPSYPSNFLNPKLLGGKAVPFYLNDYENYQISEKMLEDKLTDKTKMVLISQPNNPTTTVFRRESIEILCDFVKKHDLILVCDQAFEDHIFDGIEFVNPATIDGMWERTLIVCSISKGIGLSGFRIGYIYADDSIMDVLYGGAVNVLGAATTITSLGAIAAINDTAHLENNFKKLEKRRRIAYDILSSIPGVEMRMPESGVLSWINISQLGTSEEVADYILKQANILVNTGTPYGENGEGYLRIVSGCFYNDEDAIDALNRIKTALTKLAYKKDVV